jgi:hypothetical protein
MLSRMRVLGLSLAALTFSVTARTHAPLTEQPAEPPPSEGAIKALLDEAGLVEKLDICAGPRGAAPVAGLAGAF